MFRRVRKESHLLVVGAVACLSAICRIAYSSLLFSQMVAVMQLTGRAGGLRNKYGDQEKP